MAALTGDRVTPRRSMQEALYDDYPVEAGVEVFAGSMCEVNSAGNLQPAGTAGDGSALFVVFCREHVDNTGGAAGDKFATCEFRSSYLFDCSDALTRASVMDEVYAADDQTVTTTAGTDVKVGRITHWESANSAWVEIDGPLGYQQ